MEKSNKSLDPSSYLVQVGNNGNKKTPSMMMLVLNFCVQSWDLELVSLHCTTLEENSSSRCEASEHIHCWRGVEKAMSICWPKALREFAEWICHMHELRLDARVI